MQSIAREIRNNHGRRPFTSSLQGSTKKYRRCSKQTPLMSISSSQYNKTDTIKLKLTHPSNCVQYLSSKNNICNNFIKSTRRRNNTLPEITKTRTFLSWNSNKHHNNQTNYITTINGKDNNS